MKSAQRSSVAATIKPAKKAPRKPHKIIKRKAVPAMAVVLRDIPVGYDWGWFSREDPRMHLQTVDEQHQGKYALKVWLEKKGRRVFEPVGKIPVKVLKALEADLTPDRRHVEVRWVNFMIKKNWLRLDVSHLPKVTLSAYPGTPNKFTRTIDLTQEMAEFYALQVQPEDVTLNSDLAALEIWPQKEEGNRFHITLPEILWEG